MREFVCPKCERRRETQASSALCGSCLVWMTLTHDEDAATCTTCERVHRSSDDDRRCTIQVNVMRIAHNERVAPDFTVQQLVTWIAEPTPDVH